MTKRRRAIGHGLGAMPLGGTSAVRHLEIPPRRITTASTFRLEANDPEVAVE